MAKLNRDEELYRLVKPIIDNFRFEDSKPEEDIESILRSKIRYDVLRQGVSWFDENLLTKKDRIRELISAKEESALYDLGHLDNEIAENPVLNRRLADIGLSRIHDKKEKRRLGKLWAKGQLSTGTLFFDDFLTEERTNRTVKRKDGKIYQRSGTNEAILNDRLRQLSDAVHPDIENTVNDLREAYVDVTGMEAKNYKIPGTTYLRESVVLRTKIGKALVKNEDLASDFSNADPHYQYRFLADRWLKQKDNSNFVLKDFLQKQLNLLTGEKAVLASYKEVVQRLKQNGKITGDIEVSDKLSVHDQIQQYRKALSGNVYDIADIMPSSSPAYLDLVESKKKTDFSLYKNTAKELSKDLGLWDKKTEQLINKNVPLSDWKEISEDIKQRQEKLFSPETSLEDFRKLWEDRVYRNSVSWTVVKNKEGREIRVPEGITRFNGKVFRTEADKEFYAKFKDEHERFIAREQRILEGPVRQDSVKTLNSFGALLQQKQTSSDVMSTIAAVKESSNFSEAYKGLSEQQKKLYDYNYGKPVEAKGVFYHSVYDIPDKIWEEEEKAAGFSKPRQRGQAVVNYDINVAQEEELQKKITEDLKNRSWELPVKEKIVSKSLTESVSEQQFLEQEARENLEKMLSVSREKSKTVKLGGMGVMAAFALFNIAMTGPSREAEEHKRRVEEERKRKMYGY